MRRFFTALFILVLIAAGCYASDENRAYFPPVLMYHELNMPPKNNFDTTPEQFASQLDWLQDNGYRTLSLEEFI